LFMVFVDIEKAFDRVPREIIWWSLSKKGVLEREIKVIMEMYKGIKTAVRLESVRLELFDVKVGVYQGSVLSPFLFTVVMDEVTKNIRECLVKEILYADDLVLLGDDWKEVELWYSKWKKVLSEKGMKVNVKKTKAFCTSKRFTRVYSYKFPCPVCGKGVGRNSIMCVNCKNWVHKRCSGVKSSIAKAKNFK